MISVARNTTRQEGDEDYDIPQSFRDALEDWLAREGNTIQALADRVGCHRTLISQIKNGVTKRTGLLPKICEVTGIPFPHPHLLLAKLSREIDAMLPGWSEKELAHLQETLRMLQQKK